MEVKKIVRKATAIAASASFIGATMLGAVAQDLASYPAPFVKDGMFDGFIVVGESAQPQDVVGAVDVGASLQFALKKATSAAGSAADASISEGIKIQKSGQKFNYGDTVNSVLSGTKISQEDLPSILADGKYVESEGDNKNSETYTQDLFFPSTGNANLTYAQDDDLAPKAGSYLFIDKNTQLYNYSLEFDSDVDFDSSTSTTANDDLKTTTLNIQGKTYTVTDVTLASANGPIDKMTLLSGEAVLWLTQNQPITKTVNGVEHKIEVLDVTDETDPACQIKVDDVVSIIDRDATKTVNGVQIGVTDSRSIHAQLQDVDVCQVSVGATELQLVNGDNIKVDDENLDGSVTSIHSSGTSGSGRLSGFNVVYTPKDLDDNQYVAAGGAFTDPIFGSWKLAFGGVTADYETMSLKTSGDKKASFDFLNNDGKTVELPITYDSDNAIIFFGDGNAIDDKYYAAGANGNTNVSIKTECSSTNAENCEGMKIIGVTAGGETHVFELSNIDFGSTKNTTDIKDVTYGRTFKDVDFVTSPRSNGSVNFPVGSLLSLGSFGVLNVSINSTSVSVLGSVFGKPETNGGASLTITETQASNVSLGISELDRNSGKTIPDEFSGTTMRIEADIDATNTEIDARVAGVSTKVANGVDQDVDSDNKVTVTQVGSVVTVDTNNYDWITVQVPKAEVYGNVFVAPIVAELTSAAGGVPAYTLSKLNVGAAKLDSEISDAAAQNLIVVGGPCANKVAAQVLGKTFPACGDASGIAMDTGMIKEVAQSSGKVALVVAGWEAIDTRRATRVLANYDAYALSGAMVEVTGTSLTDIQVKKSA